MLGFRVSLALRSSSLEWTFSVADTVVHVAHAVM